MPINIEIKERLEIYDRILLKIVTDRNRNLNSETLFNSIFGQEALNKDSDFNFETFVISIIDFDNYKSIQPILMYFKSLGLIDFDYNYNSIFPTSLGFIKSKETFVQEYINEIEKFDLQNELLSNQINTNKWMKSLTIILVIISFFTFVYYVLDFLYSHVLQ